MSLWDQDSPFAKGGRQGRGRPGPCAVSKKESNNARFSFASSTSPSSCSKHLDIFSLSIYEGCLSHYSPVMTPNGEAALVKNHRRAHSSPTSLPDSSWNVEPGGAAVLRRLAGSPGVTAPPRCRSVACDRRIPAGFLRWISASIFLPLYFALCPGCFLHSSLPGKLLFIHEDQTQMPPPGNIS